MAEKLAGGAPEAKAATRKRIAFRFSFSQFSQFSCFLTLFSLFSVFFFNFSIFHSCQRATAETPPGPVAQQRQQPEEKGAARHGNSTSRCSQAQLRTASHARHARHGHGTQMNAKGEIHKYKDTPPPPPSKQEEGEQHDRKGEEEISTTEKKKAKAVPPKGGCVPSSIGLVFRLCSTLLWVVPCVVRPFLPVLPGGGVFTQFTLIERLFSFRVVCLSNISFLLAMCSPFVCKLEYNNHMVNVNVEKGLDLILEKGRHASDVWAAHLTCQAPCRPSVPFFTTAPHAIRKAFVRYVRGMDKQTYSDSAPPESASRVRGPTPRTCSFPNPLRSWRC